MAGVEYQVTKVDPTDPETKGMVYQVHKVSEEVAATLGGKVYRARIINDPTEPTVAGKVYQIVLIDDPEDPAVKGKVYNAILTGGSEAVVVGPGVSPLDLSDAVAEAIDSLIAYGGTEQNGTPTPTVPVDIISNNGALKATRPSGLPAGYTALEYIESSGTQYIDTGIKITQNDRVEARYCYHENSSVGTSGRIAGGRYTSGSPRNALALGSQNGKADPTTNMFSQFGTDGAAYAGPRIVIGDWFTAKSSADGYYVNNTAYQAPIPTDDFETPYTVKLFAFEQSAPGGDPTIGCGVGRCANFKIYTNNVLMMDLVPAKNSSNVIGMYDLVNDVFHENAGTGDFVAGPNATDPITLVVEGTQETVAIIGPNLFDKTDYEEINAYVNANTGILTQGSPGTTTQYCAVIPCKPNTTYKITGRATSAWGAFTAKTIGTTATTYDKETGTVTTGADDLYLIGLVRANDDAIDYRNTLSVNEIVSTATCGNLFAIGNYKDQQDVVSGEVIRKIGAKAFDGTENWQNLSGYFNISKTDLGSDSTVMPSNSHNIICSHFETKDGTFTDGVGIGGNYVNFKYDSITTVLADWKTWLAAQYNAGTPVIVVYPLATATTETVTGQPMETAAGDNQAVITQASIDGLELEVEYEKEA